MVVEWDLPASWVAWIQILVTERQAGYSLWAWSDIAMSVPALQLPCHPFASPLKAEIVQVCVVKRYSSTSTALFTYFLWFFISYHTMILFSVIFLLLLFSYLTCLLDYFSFQAGLCSALLSPFSSFILFPCTQIFTSINMSDTLFILSEVSIAIVMFPSFPLQRIIYTILLFLSPLRTSSSCLSSSHLSHLALFSLSWYLGDGDCIPQTKHVLFPSILCPPGILVSLLASVAAVIYWTSSFFSGFYLDHNFGCKFQNIHFLSLLFFFAFNFCPCIPYPLYNYSGHSFLFSAAVLCPPYTSSLFLYCLSHSSPKNFHA